MHVRTDLQYDRGLASWYCVMCKQSTWRLPCSRASLLTKYFAGILPPDSCTSSDDGKQSFMPDHLMPLEGEILCRSAKQYLTNMCKNHVEAG